MNNEIKKVFFIVNKFSGTGFKAELESSFRRICTERKWEFDLAYTQARGHATELATNARSSGFNTVVAVGGDGTINEVAQGLVHTDVAMGIIPKGSGNGLARHLGIPVNAEQALNILFTGSVFPIDTFTLNKKLSLNVSGIGFDGYIARLFGLEKRRGLQGYTRLVLNEFIKFTEFEAEIHTAQELIRQNTFVIAIANSAQYGNNARIAPAASVRDGVLDISILKKIPPYRLDFIYSFFSGTIDRSPYCKTLRIQSASIKLSEPMSFHVDGEPSGEADSFEIEIHPASLKVLAPGIAKF